MAPVCDQMNQLFLSRKPAILVAKRYVWLEAEEHWHFCQVLFACGLLYPARRNGMLN
jgi:hypothetical protein